MRLKEGTVFWNKEPKSLVTKHCGMHVESFDHSTGKI